MNNQRARTKRESCPKDCPCAAGKFGCCFLDARTPCGNPEWMWQVDSSLEAKLVAYAMAEIMRQIEEAEK